jgi:acyl transferase domain-containing protein
VSSLGVGGTNAHVVLEEWPIAQSAGRRAQGALDARRGGVSPPTKSREYQLILLSAKTKSALGKITQNLALHFKSNPGINLPDAAYTLQMGRKAFEYRKMAVCTDIRGAVEVLSSPDPEETPGFLCREGPAKSVVFLFPGQGSQYVDMGRGVYEKEPVFRDQMDRCFEILKPLIGYDIKEILYPSAVAAVASVAKKINQTEIAQPLIFSFEYSLAQLLMHWGIRPNAMMGHSIGEYVAACLSGVFTLEDALTLVAFRGQSMQQLPPGAMLSISLPEEKLTPLLKLKEELSLAAVNSSSLCVVSGTADAIDSFGEEIKKIGHKIRPLHTSHAFHSRMMEPILNEFAEKAKSISLNKPRIPYISNVSGSWITPETARDPGYWARHLDRTVQFSRGLGILLKEEHPIFVEVGPGRTLGVFLEQHKDKKPGHKVVTLVRHPREDTPDDFFLLKAMGQLWLYGAEIDWAGFHTGEEPCRIPLHTYPFDKIPYRLDETRLQRMIGLFARLENEESPGETRYASPVSMPKHERSPGITPDRYGEEYEAPRNELEEKVTSLWQEILGFERISIHDNFFHLSGDSVSAMQLIAQVKEIYAVEVPVTDFFEDPTVAHMGKIIKKLLIEKIKNLAPEEKKRLAEQ